jgi:type IV secretory pathway TrbD component
MNAEPMHAAGYRQPQVLGGDRLLVLSAMACCVMFSLLVFALWAVAVASVVWFVVVVACQKMAKADPLMRQIVWTHIWTQRYYPARSGLHSDAPVFPKGWR